MDLFLKNKIKGMFRQAIEYDDPHMLWTVLEPLERAQTEAASKGKLKVVRCLVEDLMCVPCPYACLVAAEDNQPHVVDYYLEKKVVFTKNAVNLMKNDFSQSGNLEMLSKLENYPHVVDVEED